MSLPPWLAKGSPLREWTKDRLADSAMVLGTVTRVATREPAVALTFDDGPDPAATPRFLDVLARRDARATFFMVGKSARRHQGLALRVAREGHAAANHSWDHTSFPLLRGSWRRRQLRWCQEALPPGSPRLFRPPWGHQSPGSRLDAARLGFRVVTWDVVAEDWRGDDAQTLLDRMEAGIRPGSIVVLHDALYATDDAAHRDREPVIEAVALLLERLGGRFRFVTVPELLRLGRPRRWHWYRRSDLEWLHKQV
jgi:peptidoglycan/xylan/chitin deacetylase (PgdA/CDA1 family)